MTTTPHDLNPADLAEIVDTIRLAGVRCDLDPAKVNPPGVWVRALSLGTEHLAALTIRLEIVVVVPNTDYTRAMAEISGMWNTIHPLVNALGGPTADPYFAQLILPASPAALPALFIPLDLLTTQE